MSNRCCLAVGFLAVSLSFTTAMSAPFTQGNLVISRVGGVDDDLQNLPDSASRVRLIEVNPADGSDVQEVRLPALASDVAGTNNHRLTLNSDFRAGQLKRSVNGLFLTIGGYDAEAKNGALPGTPSVNQASASEIARVIARIDASGTSNTITALTDCYDGGSNASFRCVMTVDGTGFWTAGRHNSTASSNTRGRIRFAPYGATTSTRIPASMSNTNNSGTENFNDARIVNIFNGQLYGTWNIDHTVGNHWNPPLNRGVYEVGTGLPTTQGQTVVQLANVFVSTPSDSPYDFFFADSDTVYLADDNIPSDSGGIWKFTRDTDSQSPTFGQLIYRYTMNAGLASGQQAVRALTGQTDGNGHVVLYAITATNQTTGGDRGNQLVTVTDTGCPTGTEIGCSSADSFTILKSAGGLEVFRGVAFAPRPCEGAECIGACCEAAHSCVETTPTACASASGVFAGIQTTCATTICPLICPNPFADSNGDGDVDLDDFAQFQLCFTGNGVPYTADCKCFDRPEEAFPAGDGDVDSTDFNAFVNCATRAKLAANPACDD